MKSLINTCLVIALIIPSYAAADFIMLWRMDWLKQVKTQIDADSTASLDALKRVISEADLALQRGPFSVVDKTGFPADRDIHDYHSLAPYWWPDPDKTSGLPYIRRDGQSNPQRLGDGVDGKRKRLMVDDVTALTLAGYFTGDRRYYEHATRQIHTWFIDPRTLMNPNMQHAQYIPGRSDGRAIGIIDSRSFIPVLGAAMVLHDAGALGDADMAALKEWVRRFADWLENSEYGKQERAARNNHGTFYDLQLAVFSWFTGDEKTAKKTLLEMISERLPKQIETNGRMPHELERTKPFHYTLFNLQAIMNMAVLSDLMGMDLLAEDREGANRILAAIDFISGASPKGHDWPLDRSAPGYEPLYELIQLYDHLAGTNQFDALARQSGSAFESSRINLFLPSDTQR